MLTNNVWELPSLESLPKFHYEVPGDIFPKYPNHSYWIWTILDIEKEKHSKKKNWSSYAYSASQRASVTLGLSHISLAHALLPQALWKQQLFCLTNWVFKNISSTLYIYTTEHKPLSHFIYHWGLRVWVVLVLGGLCWGFLHTPPFFFFSFLLNPCQT